MWSLGIGVWWSTAASLISSLLSKLKARSTYFENQTCTKATLGELNSAGLLEKASIITTPTAYSNGFIHSVKPEEALGSEVVINGDFSNGSANWNIEAAWTISNGVANGNGASGTTQELTQGGNTTNGKSYLLTYEVKNYVSGTIKTRSPSTPIRSENGIYKALYVAGGPLTFVGSSFYGSITNISLKEIIDADFTFTRNNIGTRVNASGNIESVGVDLPRINYLGGSGSWLLEPEATNTATDSNDFTTGQVFVSSGNPNLLNSLTLTANATTSPDGLINASKIQIGSTSTAINRIRYTSVVVVSGNINTFSIFVKKGSGVDWFGIFVDGIDASSRVWFDLENGVLGTSSSAVVNQGIEDYGNGWYRCSMSFTTSVDTSGIVSLVITDGNGNTSYSGNLTDHHFIYGLQAESHATREYGTSYIPTSGSTVTRAADSATDAGSSDLISSTEGVLYAELKSISELVDSPTTISINNNNTTNRLLIYKVAGNNKLQFQIKNPSDTVDFISATTNTTFDKVAIKYKSSDYAVWINGVEVFTDTTTSSVPAGLTRLDFSEYDSSSPFQGNVKCVAVFKEALTDAELTCLTTI